MSSSPSWQALSSLVFGLQTRDPDAGWRLVEEHTTVGGTPRDRYAIVCGEEVIVEAVHVVGEIAGADLLERWKAWAEAHPNEVPPPRVPSGLRSPRDAY